MLERIVRTLALAALAASLAGCLTFESTRVAVSVDRDDPHARIELVYRHFESDSQKPEEQRKDFTQLTEMVDGDDFAVDAAGQGIWVKSRTLFVERGQLGARVIGLTSDLRRSELFEDSTAGRRVMVLDDADSSGVRTNGRVRADGSRWVAEWPDSTHELWVEWRQRSFHPDSSSHFARLWSRTAASRR